MIHTKLMIVDGLFVSVGSANFDPRSLRLNNEANLTALDAGFAEEQTRIFLRDVQRATRVENGKETGLGHPHELPVQVVQTPAEQQL